MRMISGVIFLTVIFLLSGISGCATWQVEKKSPPVGDFFAINGERLHVFEDGPADAPAVVLIHGASANLRDMNISLGAALSGEFRVVTLDRPGRGYSTRPDNGYELAVQAALINGVVEKLELERPVIVGQSFGGAVALRYALDHSEDMAGLVLLAPVSHEWPGGVSWYNAASGVPIIGNLLRWFVIPVYGQFAAEKGIERSFEPDDAPDNYYERSGLALLFRPSDFKSNASDIRNLKAEIIAQQDRYGEIDATTLIITGEDDSTVSPELHSKQLARQIPNAELILLPDTGHALHHAETAFIADKIRILAKDLNQ